VVRRILAYFLYGLSFSLITFTIFGPHGIVQLTSLIKDERSLVRKEAELRGAVEKTKLELSEIENNPLELERRARNDFGLSRDSEILYVEKK